MEPVRFIRSGIAASALGHLSILAVVLVFAEVHPFGSVTAETIAVDIVSPDEAAPIPEKPEPPKPQASDAFDLNSKSAPSEAPAPAPQQAPSSAATPAISSSQGSGRREAAAQPQTPPASPLPAYVPPEPDLSIKYHVMLGLPPSLPQTRSGDAFDDQASKAADLASSLVTEFRRHLRTCSKLPASIAPSDSVKVKLRVFMTPEGKLAAEPILIEASASAKGPALMQSAVSALQGCQPYAMLPADRYGEWKVLDLSFTPQDFAGG